MDEVWKDVRGYEGYYLVSDFGHAVRIKNQGPSARKNWKRINPHPVRNGYERFCFCVGNERRFYSAHRTVWEAFNGPIPDGMQINHLNGNKRDNRLANLEVTTSSQNMQHAYRVLNIPAPNNPSPGSRNGRAKLHEDDIPVIRKLLSEGKTQKEIALRLGVAQSMISMIKTGRNWQHVDASKSTQIP